MNKSKPDGLRGKVLFINADREYAEGKNQNKLRPEDIEKIDFVFTQKRELPKYSRLVDKAEIVDKHDYNLNIRRYVDNTPDPSRRTCRPTSSAACRRRKCRRYQVNSPSSG